MKKVGLIIVAMVGIMGVFWITNVANQTHHDEPKRTVQIKKMKQLMVKKLTTTASAAVVLIVILAN